ncbi:phospholipase D family protein [soil metagenome]
MERQTLLDRLVGPMLRQHPEQSGLMLLSRNLHAFAARALSARSAGRSLDLMYYYWMGDLTGGLLGNEILSAADRGVRVRLLLDDINTLGSDSTYAAFDRHSNIEVRLFNPAKARTSAARRGFETLLRGFTATRRMHNKAWIADGQLAIVGGRNIGDAYFAASQMSNFRDLDLLIVGPAVSQTEAIFDRFWNSAAAIPMDAFLRSRHADLSKLRKRLNTLATSSESEPYLRRVADEMHTQGMLAGGRLLHWTAEARVVSDPPEKAQGGGQSGWLSNVIFPALNSAAADLEIISPYFIPGDGGVERLRALAGSGVTVTILTNSLASTDVAAVHGAYAPYRKPLLEGGVKLFELRPTVPREHISLFGSSSASLHTKAFAVDRKTGFVGSFNFDPRSVSLNTEMGVIFSDRALTEEICMVFAELVSSQVSYRLSLVDGQLVWLDEQENQVQTVRREPEAGIWRRLIATLIGFLPIESQL